MMQTEKQPITVNEKGNLRVALEKTNGHNSAGEAKKDKS